MMRTSKFQGFSTHIEPREEIESNGFFNIIEVNDIRGAKKALRSVEDSHNFIVMNARARESYVILSYFICLLSTKKSHIIVRRLSRRLFPGTWDTGEEDMNDFGDPAYSIEDFSRSQMIPIIVEDSRYAHFDENIPLFGIRRVHDLAMWARDDDMHPFPSLDLYPTGSLKLMNGEVSGQTVRSARVSFSDISVKLSTLLASDVTMSGMFDIDRLHLPNATSLDLSVSKHECSITGITAPLLETATFSRPVDLHEEDVLELSIDPQTFENVSTLTLWPFNVLLNQAHHFPNLKVLILYFNNATGLPSTIEIRSLEELTITALPSDGYPQFVAPGLKKFTLSYMGLPHSEAKAIQSFPKLEHLDIDNSLGLEKVLTNELFAAISCLESLTELLLTGGDSCALPGKSFSLLSLQRCRLTAKSFDVERIEFEAPCLESLEVFVEIPSPSIVIDKFPSLEYLQIRGPLSEVKLCETQNLREIIMDVHFPVVVASELPNLADVRVKYLMETEGRAGVSKIWDILKVEKLNDEFVQRLQENPSAFRWWRHA